MSESVGLMIAGGLLAAALLAVVPLVLRTQSKQSGKADQHGEIHINVSMDEVDHEEVRIIIPEPIGGTSESDRDAHIRKQFTEAEL
jgi:hypothetical protein